jgi:hypothetical protein
MRLLLNVAALVVIVIVFSIFKLISAAVSRWRRRGNRFVRTNSLRPHGEGPPSRARGEFYVDYRPVVAKIDEGADSSEDR